MESKYVFDNRFPDDIIQYLYGPVSLDYYKFNVNGVTKKILLMADEHIEMKECEDAQRDTAITSDEFIVYLTQSCANLDKCVDFYIEKPLSIHQGNPFMSGGDMYLSKNVPWRTISSIEYIQGVFGDCSYQNYLEEPYARDCAVKQYKPATESSLEEYLWPEAFPIDTRLDNLRVHNVDIRMNPSSKVPYKRSVIRMYIEELDPHYFRQFFEHALGIKTMSLEDITKILESHLPHYHTHIDSEAMRENIRIYIRMIELMKQKVDKEVSKFIHYNIFERVASASTSALILNGIRNAIYKKYYEKDYLNTKNRELDLISALHDMYTMIRMFKNFDTRGKKGDRGPNRCQKISQQNNIIVYAGAYHIDYFRSVLGWLSTTKYLSDFTKYSIESKKGPAGPEEPGAGLASSKILPLNKDGSFESYNALMRDFCGE